MEGIIEEEPSEIPMIPVRGGEDTVTCIYRPGILDNEQSKDINIHKNFIKVDY